MKSGILNLYKEKGYTSHDAVARVRRLFGTKKVGHTGTLDPEATGVLPILVGNAVKANDLIPPEIKVYRAALRFGIRTDTEDVWGRTLEENSLVPSMEAVQEGTRGFLGLYHQIPPMYSAVKVNGKKLYEYARAGMVVERKARPVFVHFFDLISFEEGEAVFRIGVSKGTYIRTLLTDLCERIGVLGAMSALEREKSGGFSSSDGVLLSDLEKMTLPEREALLIPTETLFCAYPVLVLPDFFARLIENGCAVSLSKLPHVDAEAGSRVRLYRSGAFFALGEILEEDGCLKCKKLKEFPSDPSSL